MSNPNVSPTSDDNSYISLLSEKKIRTYLFKLMAPLATGLAVISGFFGYTVSQVISANKEITALKLKNEFQIEVRALEREIEAVRSEAESTLKLLSVFNKGLSDQGQDWATFKVTLENVLRLYDMIGSNEKELDNLVELVSKRISNQVVEGALIEGWPAAIKCSDPRRNVDFKMYELVGSLEKQMIYRYNWPDHNNLNQIEFDPKSRVITHVQGWPLENCKIGNSITEVMTTGGSFGFVTGEINR